MNYIKDKHLITPLFIERLKEHIKNNPGDFFSKENEADSWNDFDFWPTKKTDRNHLIMSREICVIDRMWKGKHAYVICEFYAHCKKVRDLYHVINVDELNRSDWRNGYFLIPDLR